MRKVNVLEFVSLDGVIQAPGGPEEDTSGGFAYGGWTSPHSDPVLSTTIRKQMNMPFDLLIGRRTFDIWAYPQCQRGWHGCGGGNADCDFQPRRRQDRTESGLSERQFEFKSFTLIVARN
jgi:hypothetical protein